jgi:hypothetical protein
MLTDIILIALLILLYPLVNFLEWISKNELIISEKSKQRFSIHVAYLILYFKYYNTWRIVGLLILISAWFSSNYFGLEWDFGYFSAGYLTYYFFDLAQKRYNSKIEEEYPKANTEQDEEA